MPGNPFCNVMGTREAVAYCFVIAMMPNLYQLKFEACCLVKMKRHQYHFIKKH